MLLFIWLYYDIIIASALGVDEYETIHLQFSNDRFAVLVVHGGLMLKNTANIYGNKGKMEVTFNNRTCRCVWDMWGGPRGY